jgi:hypothetical protein
MFSGTTHRANDAPPLTRPNLLQRLDMAAQTLHTPEEWRPVPGFTAYEVSSLGRVRRATPSRTSAAGRIFKPHPDDKGYPCVGLRVSEGVRKKKRVHSLVCEAFHGSRPSPSHEVAHNNGVRADVRASNLRWDTHAGNLADMVAHSTSPRGERQGAAKLTESIVRELRARRAKGEAIALLSREFGVHWVTVYDAVTGRRWKHVR